MKISAIAGLVAALAFLSGGAAAEDIQTYTLTLKGHKFSPEELSVPSAKPFYLVVVNQDETADEFEMSAPSLEKIIQPGAEGRVRVRPLAAGKFPFFDDFHPDAKGTIVAE